MVTLCGHIAHHQLAGPARLQAGQADVFHGVGQAFHALAHLPDVICVLLQDGNTDIGALGRGVQHGGILPAVTVQVLPQEGRKQLALHGVFELCTLAQPVVQSRLHGTVIAGKARRTQKLFHLCPLARHTAACKAKTQQCRSQPQAEPF